MKAVVQFPDGSTRLVADPNVVCWAGGSYMTVAAYSAIAILLALALSFVALYEARRDGIRDSGMGGSLFPLAFVWALALAVAFLTGRGPVEVALCLLLASTARLAMGYGLLELLPAALALATLALLARPTSQAVVYASAAVEVAVFAGPAVWLGLGPLRTLRGAFLLRSEAVQASRTVSNLKEHETVTIIVVRTDLKKTSPSRDRSDLERHPRLVVTSVASGAEPSLRMNSRTVILDRLNQQPVDAHCLTFSLPDAAESAHFLVEVSSSFMVDFFVLAV